MPFRISVERTYATVSMSCTCDERDS